MSKRTIKAEGVENEQPHIEIKFDSYEERDRWLADNHPYREALSSHRPGLYYSEGTSLGVNGLSVFTWRNDDNDPDEERDGTFGPDVEEQNKLQEIMEEDQRVTHDKVHPVVPAMKKQEEWNRACEADGVDPSSKFVIFSKDNPEVSRVNKH